MKHFNADQASFKRLARHLKDGLTPVVVWSGAGISKPGGGKTWPELLEGVLEQAIIKANSIQAPANAEIHELIDKCKNSEDYWAKFTLLQRALGRETFCTVIRDQFAGLSKSTPQFYTDMWKLGVSGFITTNLDRFAIAGSSDAQIKPPVTEFDGINIDHFMWLLQKREKFVLNVHGRLDNDMSWVLTRNALDKLFESQSYLSFLQTILRTTILVFVGCTPKDVSVSRHLEKLSAQRWGTENHYWLTDMNDLDSDKWAENNMLARIHFENPDKNFSGISEFINNLKRYSAKEETPPIVVPPIPNTAIDPIPSPLQLISEPSVNRIRRILNSEAVRILTLDLPTNERNQKYSNFTTEYEEVLHRAWFISTLNGAELFDLQIFNTLKRGAFGQVYEAIDPSGKRVAVKVLHGNVKDDMTMLSCFRRGVQAMRLLSESKVDGIVPYLSAWEIPTCAVMEFIDGVNLQEAIDFKQINTWGEICRISNRIASIIRTAHATPAGVLHRDLRPANIMLEGKEDCPDRNVLILDFDLCWHHDAPDGASLQLNSDSSNAYISPEQLDPSRRHLTRKALVDSFGIGMVYYFLIARANPIVNQYMFKNWSETLHQLAMDRPCKVWRSLPLRFVRIVEYCTANDQAIRWDVSRIEAETNLLLSAYRGSRAGITAEMLAEELMCRAKTIIGKYRIASDRSGWTYQMREGYDITLAWDERNKLVRLRVQWLQTGDFRFEGLKRYIKESSDSAKSAIRSSGWMDASSSFASGGLSINACVSKSVCDDDKSLTRLAEGIDSLVECLTKLAAKA